ncbi:MAG: methyltransferase [Micrococcales bacterium 73-13]|nr:MAG: methyltransferase [Micrococcales bacterium 73-13]
MTKTPGYGAILIDPPTDINQQGAGRGASEHYDLLPIERLRELPVPELAAPNCHLYLWSTNSALEESFRLIRQWGFTPRSILTWVKPRIGLGHYLRNATEQLLLATRGRAPVLFKGQPSWTFAPLQAHSQKPAEQFAIIERLSPGPRLELFARRKPESAEPWDYWGNEVPSTISLLNYGWPVPSDFDEQVVAETS